MERTVLHLAIDSFAIQAERARCPKLLGRPVVLARPDAPRPRVLAASREARAAGVRPGAPLSLARRLCRDLIALPPDVPLYAGVGEAIAERLQPFAPAVEPGAGPGGGGRFFLDLTGVARALPQALDRALRAGREVERAFALHPTLGVAANKLVSRVAAGVVAPDGELLDVSAGSEAAFLAPLPVRVLPASRARDVAARLDLLNARWVRDVQALTPPQLAAAFGPAGLTLGGEARGIDATPVRSGAAAPRVVIEETLARDSNDGRALAAHAARLARELGAGLRARGEGARRLVVRVLYADGRDGSAARRFSRALRGEAELRAAVVALAERAAARRVRVRRLRLEAVEIARGAAQLELWGAADGAGPRGEALEAALDGLRARFGADALVPAAWMAHDLVLRPSARS